ncbi:MAG: right-handed parallel beta-helix repeat-containing protein [Myxococcota bacterium]
MRGLRVGVLLGTSVIGMAACPSVDPFLCASSGQCIRNGEVGVCEPSTSRCAYEDPDCESGLRYPSSTDRGLGGVCVEPGTGTSGQADATSTTSAEDLSTSSGAAELTTLADATDEGGASTAATCVLEPTRPITHTDVMGPEVAEASITASTVPAVRIDNSPDAFLHDLDITFAGTTAIVIEDSPGARIQRVRLHNVGAADRGPAAVGEFGIRIERSDGVLIEDVYVEDARTGVAVLDSSDITIERVWVVNARGDVNSDGKGSDDGGDCILLQTTEDATVREWGCTNTPSGFEAHAGVFVDRSSNVLVEGGIADEISQASGAGVRIHTTTPRSGFVTVRDVDVVGGRHSCFDTLGGREVTFENTGCRNHPGIAWLGSFDIEGPMRVIGGRYYNVNETSCCEGDFVEFDVVEDQFVPRLPPSVAAPCTHVGG